MRAKLTLLFSLVFMLLSIPLMAQKSKTSYYYNESSARNIEPGQRILTTPLIADVKVISSEKIKPYTEVFPFVMNPQVKEAVPGFKRTAFAHAAKENNADILVGTDITVTTNDDGYVVVTVTGYPARYANFRNATAQDTWMLEFYRYAVEGDNLAIFADPDNAKASKKSGTLYSEVEREK